MARLTGKNTILYRFRASQQYRKILEKHALRLGLDMGDILRDAMIERLNFLEEQEAAELERKRLQEARKVPSTPMYKRKQVERDTAALPTMPTLFDPTIIDKQAKEMFAVPSLEPKAKAEIHEKLRRSFRRWAEFIEIGTDASDRERRAGIVKTDMQERTRTEEEMIACFEAFKTFLEARNKARVEPSDLIEIADDVPIFGDAD